jgi:hypothetical protein
MRILALYRSLRSFRSQNIAYLASCELQITVVMTGASALYSDLRSNGMNLTELSRLVKELK